MGKIVHAWAAHQKGGPLSPFIYETAPLGPHDILLNISHCGICHSDLHLLEDDWRMTHYPFVPGHEVIGTIAEIGAEVDRLTIGQCIGVGWQRGSCQICEWCRSGDVNACAKLDATCVGHYGGFADHMVVDSRFAVAVPENLDPAHAAPLLCGGGTTFTPMLTYQVNGLSKVAVIGVGGLGHLGIQFASAFGANVTAFSNTASKEKEAKTLGAHEFICGTPEGHERSFDLILNTSPGSINLSYFASLLRPHGTLCQVGVPGDPLQVEAHDFIAGSKSFSGSAIASVINLEKMLQFCARKSIKPMIETFPIDSVNDAINKLRDGKIRYRAVLCLG